MLALHFKLFYLHFKIVIARLCPDLNRKCRVTVFAFHVRDPTLWIVTQCFHQCHSGRSWSTQDKCHVEILNAITINLGIWTWPAAYKLASNDSLKTTTSFSFQSTSLHPLLGPTNSIISTWHIGENFTGNLQGYPRWQKTKHTQNEHHLQPRVNPEVHACHELASNANIKREVQRRAEIFSIIAKTIFSRLINLLSFRSNCWMVAASLTELMQTASRRRRHYPTHSPSLSESSPLFSTPRLNILIVLIDGSKFTHACQSILEETSRWQPRTKLDPGFQG